MSKHNIRKTYKYALANLSEDELNDAKYWYDIAQNEARDVAIEFDMPVYIVAGVIAAISPNLEWGRNKQNAYDLIKAYLGGDDMDSVKVSAYPDNKRKAWRILQEMPDYDEMKIILNGQKIVPFYSNIMGEDVITIDGHARNIYYNERVGLTTSRNHVGKKEYRHIASEYAKVAKELGLLGRELQAITWVAWKKKHNI